MDYYSFSAQRNTRGNKKAPLPSYAQIFVVNFCFYALLAMIFPLRLLLETLQTLDKFTTINKRSWTMFDVFMFSVVVVLHFTVFASRHSLWTDETAVWNSVQSSLNMISLSTLIFLTSHVISSLITAERGNELKKIAGSTWNLAFSISYLKPNHLHKRTWLDESCNISGFEN